MDKLNKELESKYENKFNDISLSIVDFICNICTTYNISKKNFIYDNRQKIKDFIKNTPQEPIACFLKYIYSNDTFRYKITTMDESFYEKFSNKNNLFQNYKAYYFNNMYDFSNIWEKIDIEYKDLIKRSMYSLIRICEKYIEIMYKNRVNIKNINNSSTSEYSIDSISLGSD